MKEEELALKLKNHLEGYGLKVIVNRNQVDLLTKKGLESIAFELKTADGFDFYKALGQAMRNKTLGGEKYLSVAKSFIVVEYSKEIEKCFLKKKYTLELLKSNYIGLILYKDGEFLLCTKSGILKYFPKKHEEIFGRFMKLLDSLSFEEVIELNRLIYEMRVDEEIDNPEKFIRNMLRYRRKEIVSIRTIINNTKKEAEELKIPGGWLE